MNSFTKFAEESLAEVSKPPSSTLTGGGKNYVSDYVNSLFQNSNGETVSSVQGGVEVMDGVPPTLRFENGDLSVSNLTKTFTQPWSKYYYQMGMYKFSRYFLGIAFFVMLYWLLAPGQMLQIWNSRSFCNTQVYGKGTLGMSVNPTIDTTYNDCQTTVAEGLPTTANETEYVAYRRCENLLTCSNRGKWGSYFISFPSILFHGILLGVILTLIGTVLPMVPYLDKVVQLLSTYTAYFMGLLFFALYFPFGWGFRGYEETIKLMPNLNIYTQVSSPLYSLFNTNSATTNPVGVDLFAPRNPVPPNPFEDAFEGL